MHATAANQVRMITWLLVRLFVLMAAFGITAWLLDGMEMSGGFFGYVWVALLFAVVNIVLGTILRLLTLPLILITFGLFAIIVNAALLGIVDWLTDNLSIDEFWWTTIWAAIILGLTTAVLDFVVGVFFVRRDEPRSVTN